MLCEQLADVDEENEPPRRQGRQEPGVGGFNVTTLPRDIKRIISTHKMLADLAPWRLIPPKASTASRIAAGGLLRPDPTGELREPFVELDLGAPSPEVVRLRHVRERDVHLARGAV